MTNPQRFTKEDVLKAVTTRGITSEQVAASVGMSVRSARIHLAKLFAEGAVTREGTYDGRHFQYVYRKVKK